jgi:hypothetical protein
MQILFEPLAIIADRCFGVCGRRRQESLTDARGNRYRRAPSVSQDHLSPAPESCSAKATAVPKRRPALLIFKNRRFIQQAIKQFALSTVA